MFFLIEAIVTAAFCGFQSCRPSLTKNKTIRQHPKADASRAADIIKNWIRTRSTLEFLGTWEKIYNPTFKVVEFDHFKSQAGLASFVLSPTQWVEKTNAIGIFAKAGRYGGTYAHKDIAFEFGSAISAEFKLYLIKEFQRLKADENDRLQLEWNLQRTLAKVNYHIHTDAIKENLIPASLSKCCKLPVSSTI